MSNGNMPPPPAPPPPEFSDVEITAEMTWAGSQIDYETELLDFLSGEATRTACSPFPVSKLFRPVVPIKQYGPTCGLVALAMGLPNQEPSAARLLDIAMQNGWSKIGEMFSCKWIAALAKLAGANPQCIEGGIVENIDVFAQCLETGGSILVPYDKDKNNMPGMYGGGAAHWALVTGLVSLESAGVTENTIPVCRCPYEEKSVVHRLHECLTEYIAEPDGPCLKICQRAQCSAMNVAPYVCAYQGLSQHLQVWPLLSLARSNSNLKAAARIGQVILPPEGVEGGLAGQAVCLMQKP